MDAAHLSKSFLVLQCSNGLQPNRTNTYYFNVTIKLDKLTKIVHRIQMEILNPDWTFWEK